MRELHEITAQVGILLQKTNTSYSLKQGRSLKKRERCQA